MISLEKFLNRERVIKPISQVEETKKAECINFIIQNLEEFTKYEKRFLAFIDIVKNNESDFVSLYKRYQSIHSSTYEAKRIRFGIEYCLQYERNLKNRPKIDRSNHNIFSSKNISKKYNISIAEAEKIVSSRKEVASKNSIRMHEKFKMDSQYCYRSKSPMCIEYWIDRCENVLEANKKHLAYIKFTRTNREGFSLRHGKEKADTMFDLWVDNRRNTWIEKYGTSVPSSGKTSKQSLRFFIPLYKNLRKMGIRRDDIYWGISGSREYTHYTPEIGNIFFDFTIKSLRFIIEYNGSFWHSHPDREYKGFLDEETVIYKDLTKKRAMESRGYTVRYVWDFENHRERIETILDEIRTICANQ